MHGRRSLSLPLLNCDLDLGRTRRHRRTERDSNLRVQTNPMAEEVPRTTLLRDHYVP
jgi:hypothetical protein